MEQCIYCGYDKLAPEPSSIFTCPQCGLQLTIDELVKSCMTRISQLTHRQIDDQVNANDYDDEEETLASVWQLMQNGAWEKALTILLPSILPTKHPLEFTIWRTLCKLAPTLLADNLTARYQLFDILQHNLGCLDYFIASYPSDKRYLTLQKLYQALMLLGRLDVNCLSDRARVNCYRSIDITNRRRANIILKLAEVLETMGADPKYGTDYLKMSVRLYNQSLEAAREYCNILDRHNFTIRNPNIGFICVKQNELQMPSKTRRHISDKITQLNAAITQRDAAFIPQEKSPDPRIMPLWLGLSMAVSTIALAVLVLVISLRKDIVRNGILGDLLFPKNNSAPMVVACIGVCLFLVAACVVIWLKYDNTDYNKHYNNKHHNTH